MKEAAIRIALFSGNYNYLREGANQALNRLVKWLEEEAGHDVRVYSPVTDTPAFEPAGTLVPVPSIALPVRSEFRLALGLPSHVRRDVERFRPDIIHVSTPDILNVQAQRLAKRLGVPVVASQHTLFETYLDYYRMGWLRPLAEAHLAAFYRRCDHVLAPTAALAENMRHIVAHDNVSIWGRGVDRALFNPERRDMSWRRAQGIDDNETVLLFFGRLVLEKGISHYVAVVESLRNAGSLVHPLVVGDGPGKANFSSLKGAVMTGHLEGAELARAIASADIFFHPSLTETFGNVLLEAMACGLPIVAADSPASRALLDDGRTGLLCAPADIGDANRMISDVMAFPMQRRALGEAALLRSARYSWEAASASVESAYVRLVDNAR